MQLWSIDKMAMNQEKELFVKNECASYSLEVVHCHPASVDILACKCSTSPLIRWL